MPAHDTIMADEAAKADAEMKAWTAKTTPMKAPKLKLPQAAE